MEKIGKQALYCTIFIYLMQLVYIHDNILESCNTLKQANTYFV
jgi:hypothetical protein